MALGIREALNKYAMLIETDGLQESQKIHVVTMLRTLAKGGALPWVTLTNKERIECSEGSWMKTIKNIEDKLKEKNYVGKD